MSVLFVGGDRLEGFERRLLPFGFDSFSHLSGRKKRDHLKKRVSEKTNLCILFTNFVSHNLAERVRSDCKKNGIPLIFTDRKWSKLQQKLEQKIHLFQ